MGKKLKVFIFFLNFDLAKGGGSFSPLSLALVAPLLGTFLFSCENLSSLLQFLANIKFLCAQKACLLKTVLTLRKARSPKPLFKSAIW